MTNAYNEAKSTYYLNAANDSVVTTGRAYLHRIVVGTAVNSSVIKAADHATACTDDNLIFRLAGNSLGPNVYEIGVECTKGIVIDVSAQTCVTVVWSPLT